MKKILQPIVYLLISTWSVVFMIGAWAVIRASNIPIFWGTTGVLIALVTFLIFATSGLFLGNYLTNKVFEKKESIIKKHIRQSSIFYALFIYQISQGFSEIQFFSINCRVDCDDFIPFALISLMPLLAIIANGAYISFKRNKNIT